MIVKQIPIDALAVGMHIVTLDRPWAEVVGWQQRNRIECPEDIALLKQHGVQRVTIDPTLSVLSSPEEEATVPTRTAGVASPRPATAATSVLEAELARAHTVRSEAITVVQSIFEGVKIGAPIRSEAVREAVQLLVGKILHGHDALLSLAHIRQYDANLFTHSVDVCVFALVVGKHQGFEKVRLEHLGMGALLHDVGYLRLPRNLLRRQGVYTAPERRLMQQHTRLGTMILSQTTTMHEDVQRIVLEHHERVDGSGYPAGLRSLEISPLSEIVSIVDTYDALLSSREDRPPMPPAQAIKELYKCGLQGQYDRRLIECVIQCLGIYPVGSLVALNTGERAVVIATNQGNTLKPTVKILANAAQQPYPEPFIVDLASAGGMTPERHILRVIDPQQGLTAAEQASSHAV
jgi:HD-GYP domain-containing protein (c-di-GMP phosphodiesterase class II)